MFSLHMIVFAILIAGVVAMMVGDDLLTLFSRITEMFDPTHRALRKVCQESRRNPY